MDIYSVWISARRQLFTSWFLHLRDTSMLTTAAEQGVQNGPTRNVDYCSRAGGIEWAHQEAEMLVEHIAYLLII